MKGPLIVTIVMLALVCVACAGSLTGDDEAGRDTETTVGDPIGSEDRDAPAASDSATTETTMSAEDPLTSTTEPGSTIVTNIPKETEPTPSTTSPPDRSDGVDPGLAPLVDQAKTDLSNRLGVDHGAIEVISAELVEWPDTSLGCPQPGMAYTQVPTDGSLIILVYNGVEYRYHTGGSDSTPFLCE